MDRRGLIRKGFFPDFQNTLPDLKNTLFAQKNPTNSTPTSCSPSLSFRYSLCKEYSDGHRPMVRKILRLDNQ